jgi:hypothetical protein
MGEETRGSAKDRDLIGEGAIAAKPVPSYRTSLHAKGQRNRPAFDCRMLLFLWRHLTLIKISFVFLCVYAGFWWLAWVRLNNPHIRGRMQFAAEFIALKESDPATATRAVTDTLTRVRKDLSDFSFHYDQCSAATRPAVTLTDNDFIAAASKLALTRDGSYEFQDALKIFNAYAAIWYDQREPELTVGPDFFHDDQLRGGAAVSLPQGSMADLRHDAEEFLQNYQMFEGHFSAASEQAKLRPWILFKFYDPKRYLLSHNLPFAFGTLLLACSLLLQFRFIDLSKTHWTPDAMFPLPKRAIDPRWPKVWRKWPTGRKRPSADQRNGIMPMAVSELVPPGRLKLWTILAVGAAIFVEMILDVPGVRAEWIVNVPLITATAIVLVVIWSTLAEMGDWRLDLRGIGRATRECRARVLRPFLLGGTALVAATSWMVSYSLTVLPLGRAEVAREIAQIIISLVTLVFLVRLGCRLYAQQARVGTPWKITEVEEEALNAEKVGWIDSTLPNVDENMMKALLLAIVPFASIVESLLG